MNEALELITPRSRDESPELALDAFCELAGVSSLDGTGLPERLYTAGAAFLFVVTLVRALCFRRSMGARSEDPGQCAGQASRDVGADA